MKSRHTSSSASSSLNGTSGSLEEPIIEQRLDVEDGTNFPPKCLEDKETEKTIWARLWHGDWEVKTGPDGYKPFWYEAALCCSFTTFLAFIPSEPHLTTYLREVKGFTDDQINSQIYPWSTYACIPFLLVGGCLSEFVGYKLALILGAMGRLATRFLLLFGNSLLDMQIMQCTYAFGTAAEEIFYGYLFHVVPKENYQKLTSMNLASHVFSHMISGIVGDVMINACHMSQTSLMWVSAASVIVAAIIALFLTGVKRDKAPRPKEVWKAMKWAYEDKVYVLILFWWIFGNCAYGLIDGYEASLYDMMMVEEGTEENYNGTVYAIAQLIATISALSVAVPRILKVAYHHQHVTVGSLGLWCILALTLMVWYPRILPMCIGFILYYLGYHFINAFVSAETGRVVNKHMKEEGNVNSGCYAIIVMFNNLTAYILSTILSLIMFTWFQIDLRTVYKILWIFQLSFQAVFMILATVLYFWSKRHATACDVEIAK